MKTYELKSGDITFTVEDITSDAVGDISTEQLIAIVKSGVANWAYRAGARKKNNGKVFTLGEIANDILESGTRDGEPSKADVENAIKIIGPLKLGSRAKYPVAKDATEEEQAKIHAMRETDTLASLLEKVDKFATLKGYPAPEMLEDESLQDFCARWVRLHRLHVARVIKKASDLS